jgi:hypothetical protein
MLQIVGLIFNFAILAALVATIVYCIRLSKQFNEMQANRRAFEALIQSLNVAIARADTALKNIRETAVTSGEALQEKHNRARAMAEELEIMIQAGDNLANRLQTLAEQGRRAHVAATTESAVEPLPEALQPRTRAEKELLEAVKAKAQT